jgi:glycosyltransferase involved in cell wall biosynthesis
MSQIDPGRPAAPWLSILLPVFNVGAALDDCLHSILDQHVDGIELVLVDDASSSSDAHRLDAWQSRRPDVIRVVTHARNLGVSAARNTLLSEARGTYLWFVDPDDVVEPASLASLRGLVESLRPDMVVCDFRTFADVAGSAGSPPAASVLRPHVQTFKGRSNELSNSGEELIAGLFRTGQLHPWTKIVRRSAWPTSLRFPVGRVFEDLAVFPRVALAAPLHFHVPEVWISYRQREGSVLATLDQKKIDDWTLALTGFAQDLRASPMRQDADMYFEVAHFCARTLLRAMRRDRRLPLPAGRAQRMRTYAERWRESSPMDARTLARAYFARGMVGRWAQWQWKMWRVAK